MSSDFLGVVEEGWKFKCRYSGHTFISRPDSSAPTTPEEVAAWMDRQRAARISKLDKRQ